MRCVVTGGTGYIGGNLCKYLKEQGHDVLAFVRKASNCEKLKSYDVGINICETYEEMVRSLREYEPDVVFHLASLFIARHKPEQVEDLTYSNITFPTLLLDAMTEIGIKNLVNIGTSWQQPHSNEYEPSCLYAATKQAFMDIIKYYECIGAIRSVTLKLFDTYGPDDPRPKIINLLKKIADTGEPLKMSPGEQYLDIVHIDDVVRAIAMAGEYLCNPDAVLNKEYIVTTGNPHRLKDIVAIIEIETGKKLNVEWGELPYRPREIMKPWAGGEWVPGWKPEVYLIAECKIPLQN